MFATQQRAKRSALALLGLGNDAQLVFGAELTPRTFLKHWVRYDLCLWQR